MDWFQHSTGSNEDPDLSDAWDKFGDAAVTVFWTTLEIYGKEFKDVDKNGELKLSLGYVSRKMRRKFSKFQKIFEFFQERGRFCFRVEGDFIYLIIPKFIEKASNWTKRPKSQSTEEPTDVTTEAPTAKEIEKKEKKKRKERIYTERFLTFYELYPKKEAKAKAADAWESISVDAPLFEKIKVAVAKQIKYKDHLSSTKQFCPEWPHPATWLNQRRWEDEIPEIKQPVNQQVTTIYKICPHCRKEVMESDLEGQFCIHCAPRKPLSEIMGQIGQRIK